MLRRARAWSRISPMAASRCSGSGNPRAMLRENDLCHTARHYIIYMCVIWNSRVYVCIPMLGLREVSHISIGPCVSMSATTEPREWAVWHPICRVQLNTPTHATQEPPRTSQACVRGRRSYNKTHIMRRTWTDFASCF